MWRRLFNVSVAASLALSLTFALLLGRSFFVLRDLVRKDFQSGSTQVHQRELFCYSGWMMYRLSVRMEPPASWEKEGWQYSATPLRQRVPPPSEPLWLYRHVPPSRFGPSLLAESWVYGVRLWALLVLGMLLPFLNVIGWFRSRRPPVGVCRSCGYDLRATPGRCPEYGIAPVKDQFKEGSN